MSQANQVQLQGVLTGGPNVSGFSSGTLMELLPVSFCDTLAAIKNGILSNLISSDVSPFTLPFDTIVAARVIAFRLLAGATVKLNIRTALGVASLQISDQFLLRVRNPGDEVLGITISTNAQSVDLAYLVAGDVT